MDTHTDQTASLEPIKSAYLRLNEKIYSKALLNVCYDSVTKRLVIDDVSYRINMT